MKKILLSTIVGIVLLSTTACSVGQNSSNGTNNGQASLQSTPSVTIAPVVARDIKIASTHADFIIYDSLSEVEKHADLIILAKFIGERELNEYKTEEGHTFLRNSISTIKILKSFKGEVDVDSTIQTFEPGYYQEKDSYVTIEGYNLMNEEGEYILFLKKNEAGPVHTIVGMYQGKYDLNMPDQVTAKVNETDIKSEYLGENVEQFNKLKQEVIEKYR